MRVTWDNVFKALSPRPGLQEALLSPLLIVISDQWKHRDVRIVGRAFPGPYSSLITPGYLILRSGLDKFHRVRWTGCYHFGSVWIVKSLLVPLLKGKKKVLILFPTESILLCIRCFCICDFIWISLMIPLGKTDGYCSCYSKKQISAQGAQTTWLRSHRSQKAGL